MMNIELLDELKFKIRIDDPLLDKGTIAYMYGWNAALKNIKCLLHKEQYKNPTHKNEEFIHGYNTAVDDVIDFILEKGQHSLLKHIKNKNNE